MQTLRKKENHLFTIQVDNSIKIINNNYKNKKQHNYTKSRSGGCVAVVYFNGGFLLVLSAIFALLVFM